MRLNVTLISTDNTYLTDQLPLRGEIQFFELGNHGRLIHAVFRILGADGRIGVPVEVKNPEFVYDPIVDMEMFKQRAASGGTV